MVVATMTTMVAMATTILSIGAAPVSASVTATAGTGRSPAVVAMLAFTLAAFFGVAGWALVRTLRRERRKVEIRRHQDRMDTYSPRALAELREWIEDNPDDPLADRARRAHDECVTVLRTTDMHVYDWSDEEIAELEERRSRVDR